MDPAALSPIVQRLLRELTDSRSEHTEAESWQDGNVGFSRRLERLSLVVVAAFLLLTLGVTSAAAAPKTNKGTSRTIGTCTVITHPTAARHTVCGEANLQNAPLSHADLSYAVLTGAKLNNADLAGANLTQANLTKAVLSGANLAGVTWSGTTCPDATNSNEAGDSCSAHLSTTASRRLDDHHYDHHDKRAQHPRGTGCLAALYRVRPVALRPDRCRAHRHRGRIARTGPGPGPASFPAPDVLTADP